MQKKLISGIVFLLAGLLFSPSKAQRNGDVITKRYTYKSLSAYPKKLFDEFLTNEIPAGAAIEATLTNEASLRAKTRVAQALLFRNANGDKEKAIVILEWILKNQYQDEKSQFYGIWKTSVVKDRFDHNWREFIGCDLIIILNKFRHLLPDTLVKDIETGLVHAAKGALKRNVVAHYTNISVMSAFLMEYVGTAYHLPAVRDGGLAKAKEIFQLYQAHKTFGEYNSPTYYGVSLVGLALWRELSLSQEMKAMGTTLEKELWHEIATSYNPDLKNMPGPYIRGYGMDMRRYFAITGFWIALALDDEKAAPLPQKNGPKYGEVSNLSTILNLGLNISGSDLKSLRSFSSPQVINRLFTNHYKGDSLKQVSTIINKNWMMGGLWGNKRVWEQIKAGTIHWKANNDIGWLAVAGDGHTNVRVNQTSMGMYTDTVTPYSLEVLIYAPDITKEAFTAEIWNLTGIKLRIKTTLKITQIEQIGSQDDKNKYAVADDIPQFYKVVYEVPPNWDTRTPLVEIIPNL